MDCMNCMSNCCKLEVEIDRQDYDHLCALGYSDMMTTTTDLFLAEFPDREKNREQLDALHADQFATIDKAAADGACVFLDRATRLCGIYSSRPQCCQDYVNGGKDCLTRQLCIPSI